MYSRFFYFIHKKRKDGKSKYAGISIKEGDSGERLELLDIVMPNGSYQSKQKPRCRSIATNTVASV